VLLAAVTVSVRVVPAGAVAGLTLALAVTLSNVTTTLYEPTAPTLSVTVPVMVTVLLISILLLSYPVIETLDEGQLGLAPLALTARWTNSAVRYFHTAWTKRLA
jgi:hypothetical protein